MGELGLDKRNKEEWLEQPESRDRQRLKGLT